MRKKVLMCLGVLIVVLIIVLAVILCVKVNNKEKKFLFCLICITFVVLGFLTFQGLVFGKQIVEYKKLNSLWILK